MGTAARWSTSSGTWPRRGWTEVQFVYFDLTTDSLPAFLASAVMPQVADL